MRRIILLVIGFFTAIGLSAYNLEIVGMDPAFMYSNNIPVYSGLTASEDDETAAIINIKTNYGSSFNSVIIDEEIVSTFASRVTSAEIDIYSYLQQNENNVAHKLEACDGSRVVGTLYFTMQLPKSGGCYILCPKDVTKATVIGYDGNVQDVRVPEEIQLSADLVFTVAYIDYDAFKDAVGMESISIPNTIETIQARAFTGSAGLQKVVFEDGPNAITLRNASSLTGGMFGDANLKSVHLGCQLQFTPGYGGYSPLYMQNALENITFGSDNMNLFDDMFAGCSALKSIVIPENVTLPSYENTLDNESGSSPTRALFSDCIALEQVEVFSQMTSTQKGIFMHCTSLKSVKLPAGIELIAPYTFWDCQQLPSIPELPKLSKIGGGAFRNCLAFKDIVIPESVTEINGSYAFGWCENLTSLTIPSNIEKLTPASVFDFCNKLSEVTYDTDNPKSFNRDLFYDSRQATLYVPGHSIDKFKDILPWCSFAEIRAIPNPTQSISIDPSTAQIKVGETIQVSATISPVDTTDELAWSSDDETVATVDASGEVTAVSVGTATITATSGTVSATCKVTVEPIFVETITISPYSVSLEVGETLQLNVEICPENATDKKILWVSDNPSVASVNDGLVTMIGVGTCVITATALDESGVSGQCIVTGVAGVTEIFTEDYPLHIYNVQGNVMRKNGTKEDLKNLKPGIYIIHSGNTIKKIVIP